MLPLYSIEKTSQKGQVLFISTDKRGEHPIVSLLMPEQRAKQIVAALKLLDLITAFPVYAGENKTDEYCEIQRVAHLVKDLPIEKS